MVVRELFHNDSLDRVTLMNRDCHVPSVFYYLVRHYRYLGNVISSFGTYLAFDLDVVQDVSSWMQGNFSLVDSTNYQLIFF